MDPWCTDALTESYGRDILPSSVKSWVFPFRTKQSSTEWLINRWCRQYFRLLVYHTSWGVSLGVTLGCCIPKVLQTTPHFFSREGIFSRLVFLERRAFILIHLSRYTVVRGLWGHWSSYGGNLFCCTRFCHVRLLDEDANNYIGFLLQDCCYGKQVSYFTAIFFFGAFLTFIQVNFNIIRLHA